MGAWGHEDAVRRVVVCVRLHRSTRRARAALESTALRGRQRRPGQMRPRRHHRPPNLLDHGPDDAERGGRVDDDALPHELRRSGAGGESGVGLEVEPRKERMHSVP